MNPNLIVHAVSKALDISVTDIKSSSRKREICDARKISIGIMLSQYKQNKHKKTYDISLKSIQKIFKNDHSTILYNNDLFNELILTNDQFKGKFNKVMQLIGRAYVQL